MNRPGAAILLGAALMLPPAARAQIAPPPGGLTIAGTVFGANDNPLPFSTASVRETGVERFTDDNGAFVVGNLSPGQYHLRIRQLGYAALDTTVTLTQADSPLLLRIVLTPVAFQLATITVRGSQSCVLPAVVEEDGSDFGVLLAELRKNAERERLLANSYPFAYRLVRSMDTDNNRIAPINAGFDTLQYVSNERPSYVPGKIVSVDETRRPPGNRTIVIPVLADIGDPEFLRTHCFIYRGSSKEDGAIAHRIDFRPLKTLHTADIEGSAFLDAETFVIRRAVFRLTKAETLDPPVRDLVVTTRYREIVPGVAVVGEVRSVQTVRDSFTGTVRVRESQRLVDYRFLDSVPGDALKRE